MTLTLITLITLFDARSTAIIKVNVTKKAPIIGHIKNSSSSSSKNNEIKKGGITPLLVLLL